MECEVKEIMRYSKEIQEVTLYPFGGNTYGVTVYIHSNGRISTPMISALNSENARELAAALNMAADLLDGLNSPWYKLFPREEG